MIEIVNGSLEEQIIKVLQKIYPITICDLERKLRISNSVIVRVLQKLHSKGIVELEPLSDKTFIRLIRRDFRFIGKKRQKKFIKHHSAEKMQEPGKYDGDMYS
jgi:predicted transcriptional regulator